MASVTTQPTTAQQRLRHLLLALNSVPDLDRESLCRLAMGPERWAWDPPARLTPLAAELGVPPDQLARALAVVPRAGDIAQRVLREAAAAGVEILTLLDPAYPPTLRDLPLPPPVLTIRGRLPAAPAVAIVGSRRADAYGREVATMFGRELAAAGLTVVSGFALGVDAAAHRGALETPRGETVAVLGSGLDVDYPRGHRRLGDAIAGRGALLSEFPLRCAPRPWHFPVRNRIIAALAVGTLVVQATPRSGSLITTRYALELGRDVYAIPGPIFEPRAAGPNTLIRDGALAAQHPRDVLESLPDGVRRRLERRPADGERPPGAPGGRRGLLLDALPAATPRSPEEIAVASGLPVGEVLALLLELELSGWLRRQPGPTFCRRS